jgi:hypothetical protein
MKVPWRIVAKVAHYLPTTLGRSPFSLTLTLLKIHSLYESFEELALQEKK